MKSQKILGFLLIFIALSVGVWGFYKYFGFESPIPYLTDPKYDLQYFGSKEELALAVLSLTESEELSQGQCFRHWGNMDWSYEHTECVNAQIEAFDATKDIKYLNYARDNLYFLYNQATDCQDMSKAWAGHTDTIGDGYKEWRCLYSNPVDHLQPGKLITQFMKYVDVVKKNNVESHMPDADKFEDFVKVDHFNDILSTWYEYNVVLSDGTTETRGCYGYIDDNNKIYCGNNNRVAQDYDMLIYLYKWTGDEKYKDMYIKWARHFKASITIKTDTEFKDLYYAWHYHDDDPQTTLDSNPCDTIPNDWLCMGQMEMGGYGNFDIVPVIHGYREGLFWNKKDITLFTNTLTKAAMLQTDIYSSSGTKMGEDQWVIGQYSGVPRDNTWNNEYQKTPMTFGWIDFAYFDKTVFDRMEQIFYNQYQFSRTNNNYWDYNYYACASNPKTSNPNNAICGNDRINPAWLNYGLVKLLKFSN